MATHDYQRVRNASWNATWGLSMWTSAAAFGTYFCMYGFRKPFTVATYADQTFLGLGYKECAVAAQVFGYMLSKFIGIRVIAQMPPARRATTLLVLIAIAQLALLAFALVPAPWNLMALFINGLSLGMVFGLVLGFLEGRTVTEALIAGLCASFILADGVVKSVGAELLKRGVPEFWMPAAAGALFLMPLAGFVGMLSRVPAPSTVDQRERSPRQPMTRHDRWSLWWRHWPGLSAIVVMFLAVTILRSIRADFAPEIWGSLGANVPPDVYARTELWVALIVTLATGFSIAMRDNTIAFFAGLAIAFGGIALIPLTLVAQQQGWCDSFQFMVLLGMGLYLPYVAVHTTIFERWIAMTREQGNIGFLMYVADAIGYLGYVAVMLAHSALRVDGSFLPFLRGTCWLVAAVAAISTVVAICYFAVVERNSFRSKDTRVFPVLEPTE